MSDKRDTIKFEKMSSSRRGQRVIYSNAVPAYDPVPEHIRRRREFKIVSPQIERNRKRARNMTPLYLVGLMLCIGFFALFCLIYQWIYHVSFRWDLVFLYAFVCTVVGQLGDLSFSLIKRSYGIKDFGRILPGHGGILDRLDSLIFIAPTFYLLLSIQPLVR